MIYTRNEQIFFRKHHRFPVLQSLPSSLRTVFPERTYPFRLGPQMMVIRNRAATDLQPTYSVSKKLVIVESKWCFGVITAAKLLTQ